MSRDDLRSYDPYENPLTATTMLEEEEMFPLELLPPIQLI